MGGHSGPPFYLLVTVTDLAPDLPGGKGRGVGVGVGRPRADGADQLGQLARGDTLRRRTDDAGRVDGPRDRRGLRWARRLAAPTAEESADAARGVALAEVDVSKQRGPGHVLVAEGEIDRGVVAIDLEAKMALAVGRDGRRLVEPLQIRGEATLVTIVVSSSEQGQSKHAQRSDRGDEGGESEVLHLGLLGSNDARRRSGVGSDTRA